MRGINAFLVRDNLYKPVEKPETVPQLLPGVYEINVTQNGEMYFEQIQINHDAIIDLPNTEYDRVVSEIEKFLKPETEAKFRKEGDLYKRSSLLYGPPGAGKTFIVNRVTRTVMAQGGVVFFSPNPRLLVEALKVMTAVQPDTVVMVIFEELDKLIEEHEGSLLNMLDGQIQKDRVIYVATTNYIDRIPARIQRPGRFSSRIPVGFPSRETRAHYLTMKGISGELAEQILANTEGFSIDELREVRVAVTCLDYSVEEVCKRIQETKADLKSIEEEEYDLLNDADEDDFAELGLTKREFSKAINKLTWDIRKRKG